MHSTAEWITCATVVHSVYAIVHWQNSFHRVRTLCVWLLFTQYMQLYIDKMHSTGWEHYVCDFCSPSIATVHWQNALYGVRTLCVWPLLTQYMQLYIDKMHSTGWEHYVCDCCSRSICNCTMTKCTLQGENIMCVTVVHPVYATVQWQNALYRGERIACDVVHAEYATVHWQMHSTAERIMCVTVVHSVYATVHDKLHSIEWERESDFFFLYILLATKIFNEQTSTYWIAVVVLFWFCGEKKEKHTTQASGTTASERMRNGAEGHRPLSPSDGMSLLAVDPFPKRSVHIFLLVSPSALRSILRRSVSMRRCEDACGSTMTDTHIGILTDTRAGKLSDTRICILTDVYVCRQIYIYVYAYWKIHIYAYWQLVSNWILTSCQ